MDLKETDRARWLAALVNRLKGRETGETYPLDNLERELLLEAIAKEWRPIETVPKNGTSVLIYSTEWGGGAKPALAHWSDIYGRWVPLERQIADEVCRHMSESNFDFCTELYEEPTHWMPLPEPPRINGQLARDVEK